MMKTPICDFIAEYAKGDVLRLHMPGHKGCSIDTAWDFSHDITEIDGADVLYHSDGIIEESQQNARTLFSTQKTLYSTEGSSLSIRAMLYLALLHAKNNHRQPLIAAGRNAHKVFMTAAALLDLPVRWVYPQSETGLLCCKITPDDIASLFTDTDQPPTAVYLTSPDYLGNLADIAGIAKICHRHGALLLVDNAHGAYLRFLPKSQHPITNGADICCDSAHKTLPALTGAAYLHIAKDADASLCEWACSAMSLFASTSPSYVILSSLDRLNGYLYEGYAQKLASYCERLDDLKQSLADHGFQFVGNEPLKLTLYTKPFGYTGNDVASHLMAHRIVPEFYDPDHVVLMMTPEIPEHTHAHLHKVLCSMEQRPPIISRPPRLPHPKTVLSVREALLSPHVTIPISECRGKILAAPAVSCPPAIPAAICGEEIDDDVIALLSYYGHEHCCVVE